MRAPLPRLAISSRTPPCANSFQRALSQAAETTRNDLAVALRVMQSALLGRADPVQGIHLAADVREVSFAQLLTGRQLGTQINSLGEQAIILCPQFVAAHAGVLVVCDLGVRNTEPGCKRTAAAAHYKKRGEDRKAQCYRHLAGSVSPLEVSLVGYTDLNTGGQRRKPLAKSRRCEILQPSRLKTGQSLGTSSPTELMARLRWK
jgi:hypothetical protein